MKLSSVRLPSCAVLTAALVLGSFASAADARPIFADARRQLGGEVSPYAHFLVARYAMAQGDIGTAAVAMNAAATGDPDNIELRENAFLVGILNGHIDQATLLSAKVVPTSDTSRFMVPMLGAVTAVKAGKAPAAQKSIDAALAVNSGGRAAVLLKPYIQALNGNWKGAVDASGDTALGDGDRDKLLIMLVQAERARIHELRGRTKDAEAVYTSLYQPGAAAFLFGPDYAGFLERRGRKAEARAVWAEVVAQSNDATALAALQRIDGPNYVKPALPDLKQSMAQALFLAATISFSERDSEMALATLRLSLHLDPAPERSRILLGQIHLELRDPGAAEAAWASVPVNSVYANEAILRRIWNLRARDQSEAALTLADQALARDPNHLGLVMEKASLLNERHDDAGALALIDARIARVGSDDFTWQTWFLQAMLYDGVDRWDKAEEAINKARTLNGTRPEILNFLGYGWINRGGNIQEGMELVRQALALNPKSGAMLDSLGWGYYKLGQYDQALVYIEQAVQLAPSDAEINEHLGDVYLALGRDVEATYEWQRVLTLGANDKQTASVKKKLDAQAAVVAAADKSVKVTALNETATPSQQ
ncbi:tetratricopeptide repeat family protein [Asticcacaulis biprosthecium C19]|uniref:Tetratricopeptide repeat family protein n=1 Tax=Asticcacaulis biprosthecium C19 TaxID=715226 RepID=F4QRB2_9CAUL|nr:tetratricopeptide repeat protein [Asticcacaulis biprosthecium]EGF90749.1 tetratricopeptide repeat family protein [Asticcacaulis biprosthecium C19]